MTSENMTVAEVATTLNTNESTIKKLLYDKKFPNAFKVGRAWRIPQRDVQAYIASTTIGK